MFILDNRYHGIELSMYNNLWNTPPRNLSCGANEAHIWLARVDVHKNNISLYKSLLPSEELVRAGKFVRRDDRDSYLLSRVALRDIVSRYLNVGFNDVSFFRNEYGKPFIAKEINRENMECNLSHSGDIVLIGMSKGGKIGIDIERIREMDEMDALVRDYFSTIEQEYFKSLSPGEKIGAFFACWSRKEAYIKARGKGLSYPLDSFSVSVGPGDDAALLHDDHENISEWSLKDIAYSPDYAGAVAVKGRNLDYRYYRWDSLTRT